ncbi:maleylpyruvate isomerase N-terminal domain-containing protein [Streptomyces sp. NPDC059679]|uniref:maleylpyruvate isomerase N-terminal domain-containing protein n=1 Tax=Streptomyces sp. NPDC059679 TaxID=3346903 RepID=UPI0036C5B73A
MSTTPVTAFAGVIDTIAHLVEAVEEEQWSAPTPCTDWNVQQMVDHLLAGQHTFAVVMGAQPPLPALGPAPGALTKAFRTSAAALVAAFERPGAPSPSDPHPGHRSTRRPQPSRGTRTTMKKTELKIAIASAALVAAVATGTALAANGSSAGSGSTSGAEQTRTEQAEQKKPSAIKADGSNVFPHSLDFDARSNTFFAGSLKHGTVSAVSPDGKVRTLIDDPEMVSAQAVLADRERDRILVSNVDYGTADRSKKNAPFRVAGVGSYDLESGKQDWCVDLTAVTLDGKQHLISDVTVAPDGTAYAVDELTPTVFRIDRKGRASVFLQNDLLKGTLDIPDFLNDVGMSAVEWVEGNQLIIAMADGSLVRVPVKHPEKAQEVKLSVPLGSPTAGMRLLKDGSIAAVSSGLLTGKPAQIQRVEPRDGWKKATVKVTDTVEDPSPAT